MKEFNVANFMDFTDACGTYKLIPITIRCDLSLDGIQQALIMLNFRLEENVCYHLYCTRPDITDAQQFLTDLVPIKLHIDESLPTDFWYLVDTTTKTIIYSPGV